MIFPSEEAEQFRQDILSKTRSGAITEEEGYRLVLEQDPGDVPALGFFSAAALAAGDLDQAETHARNLIRACPLSAQGYILLARALGGRDPASPLFHAYTQAALERLEYDENGMRRLDIAAFAGLLGAGELVLGLDKEEAVGQLLDLVNERCVDEPSAVAEELEPHRLILQLYNTGDDLMEPAVVGAILQSGPACVPLLLGILRSWGEGILDEGDCSVVERSLALLGEIGDPAALPAITEFLRIDEEDLAGPADWAFRRIAFQHPEAALQKIREMIPGASGEERFSLAEQLTIMPLMPGRVEALIGLTDGIAHLPEDQQEALAVATIAGVMVAEGVDSPLAASLETQFAGVLSAKGRSNLRDLRREALAHGPHQAEASDYTIHQICCEAPEPDHPKPGRNDPCWCGSGKKYKKCHLEQDERR